MADTTATTNLTATDWADSARVILRFVADPDPVTEPPSEGG